MRIIFFGSDPWFSPPILEAILKAEHQVVLIITKGDAFKNYSFTAHGALSGGQADLRFMEAKTAEDISRFTVHGSRFTNDNRPESIVVASFGPPFLSKEVLTWPKYGCLNVHASLLPRWRGASPVFGAIANGDKETGVSIMRMTEEIDLGPVLGQKKTIIRSHLDVRQGETFSDNDNRETLTRRLGILGGKLIVKTLKKLENGQINEVKQPQKSPTFYTHRLTKDSGRIDWQKSPVETERFIRAVTPWPGAQTRAKFRIQNSEFRIDKIKILKAHLLKSQQSAINNQQLTIDLVQLPGKNPITWKAFLAGHPEAILK